MSKGDGRSRADATGRLGVTAVVAALVAVTAIVAAVLTVGPGTSRAASDPPAPVTAASAAALPATSAAASVTTSAFPGAGAGLAAAAAAATAAQPADAETMAVSLTLTAADHQDCPAKATACVDLTRHITWLQRGGKVSYGPVQMEPGHPAGAHQTPRGTFHVSWKAGPAFRSSEYNEAMPWATFFAAGGIAFHGGPLDVWSHGCVHLTDHNAHYFQQHLPVGAEVVVF